MWKSKVDELLDEICRLLSGNQVLYHSASEGWDVYEGFIFSLLVATASRHGAVVTYGNVKEARVVDLFFRTSPGWLYSDNVTYTQAVIEFDGAPPLEAHVGVYVQGTSGVLHECDVLLLPRSEAVLSRTQQIAPRVSQCALVIECEYYPPGGVGIGLARNFEGLRADVRTQRELLVSNAAASGDPAADSSPGGRWISAFCQSGLAREKEVGPIPPRRRGRANTAAGLADSQVGGALWVHLANGRAEPQSSRRAIALVSAVPSGRTEDRLEGVSADRTSGL